MALLSVVGAAVIGVVMLLAIMLPCLFFETWVAMTLWNWFAPWPLPFGLVAGVGMNIAVSTVIRSRPAKDDRTSTERIADAFSWYFIAPAAALFVGWVLKHVAA